MPELMMVEFPVWMSQPEQACYDRMKRDLVLPLAEGEITAANAAALSGKLCQMANGAAYGDECGGAPPVRRIHDRKLDALEDLIEGANGKPVLVAYWFEHDLERIADLCRHFGRPAAVIINKADLDAAATAEIERFCLERNHPVVARLPFNPLVVDALVRGQTMAGITTNGIADIVRGAWKTIEATADLLPETISLS